MKLLGVDFSSAPSRRKPIVVALGSFDGRLLRLTGLQVLPSMAGFEALLAEPGPWLGAFDFPFGLPREFVQSLGLGDSAAAVSAELHRRAPTRMALREIIDAWGNTRPAGQRLLHRATDTALPGVRSTSPLQTRYVPVGFMYYEGFSRLLAAGLDLPGLQAGDAARTALEGYPGLLAHELVGRRSYKNSAAPDRLIARKDMVDALEQGRTRLALRLKLSHAQREALADDGSGDRLDAVLCLAQAAWASRQPRWGLPERIDPVEGCIVGAQG
ncbi:conserved hypothetical protein [Rubrivivax sp. A210]|uniref:DUF429 domain-containing protein n=1 Tax=Rubrivivax sp. A210 TaxID=2772301 RepID=UPI00191B2E68|nr:DUF429 domain-containing protein [Rubrivivax sp. A210]CAD5371619.1 conserved hypothetical protein [Rubrivivax sp. A210]